VQDEDYSKPYDAKYGGNYKSKEDYESSKASNHFRVWT
jgi:hypothetical protein